MFLYLLCGREVRAECVRPSMVEESWFILFVEYTVRFFKRFQRRGPYKRRVQCTVVAGSFLGEFKEKPRLRVATSQAAVHDAAIHSSILTSVESLRARLALSCWRFMLSEPSEQSNNFDMRSDLLLAGINGVLTLASLVVSRVVLPSSF